MRPSTETGKQFQGKWRECDWPLQKVGKLVDRRSTIGLRGCVECLGENGDCTCGVCVLLSVPLEFGCGWGDGG